MPTFDPFNMKITERACPRCADGRLQTERIGDIKVNIYCDTCAYSHIYEREAPPRSSSVEVNPPAPNIKDGPMPKNNATGLDRKQYQRWYSCGKPDVAAFKAAGCPTAAKWKKLQAGDAESPTPKPKPKRRNTKTPKPTAAPEPPALGELVTGEPLLASPPRLTKVRLIYIESQGEPGDGLKPLIEMLSSFAD